MSNITKEQQTAIGLFTCWWAMHEAQAEVIEEPFKPDQVALSFMGSGASTMVMVEHLRAVCDVLNSLAAPVASAAPSGELPPLPEPDWKPTVGDDECYFTPDQMSEYGQECYLQAIAHQPPMEALTDEQIKQIFLSNGFTVKEGQQDLKPYVYAAAHALLAATAPNKQLVEALTDEQVSKVARYLSDFSSAQCGVDKDDAWKIYGDDEITTVRAALASAGVPLKGE